MRGDGVWCDAQAGFNAVAPRTPRAAATAFVRTAATPWFGTTVTVRSVDERAPGAFTIETHARRNGIVAVWDVLTDERGIVNAGFTATRFGVPPLDASLEGLTALPGLTRRWLRLEDDLLHATEPFLPIPEAPGLEGLVATGTASDGFVIQVRRTNGPLGVTFDADTGIRPIDLPRFVRRVALENYEEFLAMGLEGNVWDSESGTVFIDDYLSLVCLACVQISTQFQIHMISEMIFVARYVLGYDWTDDDLAFSSILGHEMFHNFQNGAMGVDTNRGTADISWSEGTARMSETLHSYSHTSHVPRNILYDGSLNGCNGYLDGGAVERGPATDRFYDSCAFWLAWYADRGPGELADLLGAMGDHYPEGDPWLELRASVQDATGDPIMDDLAHFAGAIITGKGFSFAPPSGGPAIDWSLYLTRWVPPTLSSGQTRQGFLADGAMLGYRITSGGTVGFTADGPASLFEIRSSGGPPTVTARSSGDAIAGPGPSASVYLVAISGNPGGVNVSITAP